MLSSWPSCALQAWLFQWQANRMKRQQYQVQQYQVQRHRLQLLWHLMRERNH